MKVLIVDDMEMNRYMLQDILEAEGFETLTAGDGCLAMDILEEQHDSIQAILLDLHMPRMGGFEVLEELQTRSWFAGTPVIMISSDNNMDVQIRSLAMGATDFIQKPFIRQLVIQRVKTACQQFQQRSALEWQVARQIRDLQEQAERLQKNNERIIDILGTVVEYRNLESGEHIFRVRGFTEILARTMMERFPQTRLTRERVHLIATASPLHDIGKITIPDRIILKPGKLTPEEYEQMKAHVVNGAEMLRRIQSAWDAEYACASYEICLHHHERYDGSGYPAGLKGEAIPLSAQLVSVADVYDALISKRVYKDPYPPEVAFRMIQSGECGGFSPQILTCLDIAREELENLAALTPPHGIRGCNPHSAAAL